MQARFNDVWIGGAISAFGAVVLLVLIPFGIVVPENIPARAITPAFWPKVIGWTLIAFGLLTALEGTLTRSKEASFDPSHHSDGLRGLRRILLSFILLYALTGAINWIGLPIACGIVILVFGALFRERRPWLLLVIAILIPLTLYYFFTEVAGVPIPMGDLFD